VASKARFLKARRGSSSKAVFASGLLCTVFQVSPFTLTERSGTCKVIPGSSGAQPVPSHTAFMHAQESRRMWHSDLTMLVNTLKRERTDRLPVLFRAASTSRQNRTNAAINLHRRQQQLVCRLRWAAVMEERPECTRRK
jgi:hypothetical protein